MLNCWDWETLLENGENLGFLWWTCTCHRTSTAALHCMEFHAKTSSAHPENHLSWRHLFFRVQSCPPAAPASQLCRWLVLQPWGQQPTKHHTSANPHVSSPPLPLQMTVIKSFIHQSCLRYSDCSVMVAEGCSMRGAALLGVGWRVPLHRTWASVHQPRTPTWVYALCFFLVSKKSSQINWDRFFWEGKRRESKCDELTHVWSSQSCCAGWWTGRDCQAACPAPSSVRGCGGKKDMLPLPPCYPQWLNTLQKRAWGSFCSSFGKISDLQWQIVKDFLVYSLGLSIKTLNASFFLFLSLRERC